MTTFQQSSTFVLLLLVVGVVAVAAQDPECIKYEVHEREPNQAQALSKNCFESGGFLDNYSSAPMRRPGPIAFNSSFECCGE